MENPSAPTVPEISLPQRIWGVFIAPRTVFEYLRQRPRILGALLVLAVAIMVAGFLLADVNYQDRLADLDDRPNLTADERAQSEKQLAIFVKYVGPIAGGVFGPLFAFVAAGALFFIGNILLGGSARYRPLAAATAHIWLVTIPAMAVRIPLSLAAGTVEVQTSLAALLPSTSQHSVLYYALAQFDVFGLWQLGLAVLAVSVIAEVPLRKAAVGVIGAWIVWSAIWVPAQTFLAGLQSG